MKKTTLLFIVSIFIGYYFAIPAMAQKANNKNNPCDIHKTHWRDSGLLSDYPDIPLTTPYYQSNSEDEAKILNTIIPDFQVNENSIYSLAPQSNPSISADKDGNFIITWEDERNGKYDIYAQRYSIDGTLLGINFRVNDDRGSRWQTNPSISADASGNFVIAWEDRRNGWAPNIYAQRYSSNGTALGGNFNVNDGQVDIWQWSPALSVDESGNFIITWEDGRNGNDDIYVQRYSSDGTAIGSNFKVNDDQGSSNQWYPSISADGSGNFIITWQDDRNGNSDIYAQRYSSDGITQGSNFKVNDDQVDAWQYYPSISADSSGNFIITWTDERNGDVDIYGQRYSKDGIALGSNFKVNDDQGSTFQIHSAVSIIGNETFIITWQDDRNGYLDFYAQRYSIDGTALESNFKVNDVSYSIPP